MNVLDHETIKLLFERRVRSLSFLIEFCRPLKKAWKTKVRKNLSKGVGGNHKPTIGNTKNVPVLFFRRL